MALGGTCAAALLGGAGTAAAQTTGTAPPGDIYIVNADGTGLTNLTNTTAAERNASISPDGKTIVYRKQGEIWIMGLDGSNARPITLHAQADEPQWSPDGSTISFISTIAGITDPNGKLLPQIYTLNYNQCANVRKCDPVANAADFTALTTPGTPGGGPGPCPTVPGTAPSENRGARWVSATDIVFQSTRCAVPTTGTGTGRDVFRMSVPTGAVVNLTNYVQEDKQPAPDPTGTMFVWSSTRDRTGAHPGDENLYEASAVDGSGAHRLTSNFGDDMQPTWAGGTVFFSSNRGGNGYSIWGVPATNVPASPDSDGSTQITAPAAGVVEDDVEPNANTAVGKIVFTRLVYPNSVPPGTTPPGTTPPGGGSALKLGASAASKQKVVRQKGIRVTAGCSAACEVTIVASGKVAIKKAVRLKFRPVSLKLAAGKAGTALLKLSSSQLNALKRHRYGHKGRKVTVTVTISATSAVGPAKTSKKIVIVS